jgi:ABC-type Mn2+/Zn2+ transport system permease subunit
VLEHAFMQRALVAALGIGVVCGALGFFVVLRRLPSRIPGASCWRASRR